MSKIIAKESKEFKRELLEPGVYVARCYSMVHVGTVESSFQGKTIERNLVRITFELPTVMRTFNEEKGPQPAVIGEKFTLSMSAKGNLIKFLQSWRGKKYTPEQIKDGVDITKVIGHPCMLNITVSEPNAEGNQYNNIASIMPLMAGVVCPPQINPSIAFGYDPFEKSVYDSLPEWIQKEIIQTPEYKKATGQIKEQAPPPFVQGEDEDDLPF